MGVLTDSWCFCKGGGKSERIKAALFSGKGPAMAMISGADVAGSGAGFFIHRNVLLTTHAIMPSVAAAEAAEIRLQDGIVASIFPRRFFITSSVLDLTVVGLDKLDGDYLKTCSKPSLDLGSTVYILGHTGEKKLTVGEGKVVIATDNLIKLATDEVTWSSGSAGFDAHGNLAFMICDPMKLSTSGNTKSSTTSSSSTTSWKKEGSNPPMQFGIPIPVIRDWLNQHWEGNLDEHNTPRLMRLMPAGQKSEHSSASFTLRQVFKPTEEEEDDNEGTLTSRNLLARPGHQIMGAVSSATEEASANPRAAGIPAAVIYESPKLTAVPLARKESAQLLDINFPARTCHHPAKKLLSSSGDNFDDAPRTLLTEAEIVDGWPHSEGPDAEMASMGPANGARSEVLSSSSLVGASVVQNGFDGSEVETMYSAETAESRNYASPKEADARAQPVGRSQSCESSMRWGAGQRDGAVRRGSVETPRGSGSVLRGRMYSQGAASQRSSDYCSPTVASIMKKRNGSEEPRRRPLQKAVHSSPRWMF